LSPAQEQLVDYENIMILFVVGASANLFDFETLYYKNLKICQVERNIEIG